MEKTNRFGYKGAMWFRIGTLSSLIFLSQNSFAHPGHGFHSFTAGLSHPFLGLDHLIVAVGVGIWASQQWRAPLGFMAGLLAGALLGQAGFAFPWYEQGILLSSILMVLFLVIPSGLNQATKLKILSCFGIFHGNAHGLEVNHAGNNGLALLGLIISTGILHSIGIFIGSKRLWASIGFLLESKLNENHLKD